MSTIHVAIHTWGAWAMLPCFLAGIAYGRIWQRGVVQHGPWKELFDVLSLIVPAIAGMTILISAIYEYTT